MIYCPGCEPQLTGSGLMPLFCIGCKAKGIAVDPVESDESYEASAAILVQRKAGQA